MTDYPKKYICIEQYMILCIAMIFFILIYVTHINYKEKIIETTKYIERQDVLKPKYQYSYSNIENDVLLNPYAPPLNNSFIKEYKQVGYLKDKDTNKLLPLFGKENNSRRDKWNYYTINDNIKIDILNNNKNCLDPNGCDTIYTGDNVTTSNENSYEASIYKNNTFVYQPF